MKHRHRLIAVAAAMALPAAHAFNIDTGDEDTKVRLDLTPKYSTGYRLHNPSGGLTHVDVVNGDPNRTNEDDGDLNFKKGFISQRLDLLTEFDVAAKGWGLRLSGNAFYDRAYMRRNDNTGSTFTAAGTSIGTFDTANVLPGQANNEFLPATRRQHGKNAELLDAFVYLKGDVAGMRSTVRLGKHTLQWGESLFFGQNGIAAAQGPVDIAKILSVPNWQFKEVLLPVEQISTSVQVASGLTFGAYYQLKWRPSKIPGVGSYFSNGDYINTGFVGFGPPDPSNPVSGQLFYDSSKDQRPKDTGQGGLQLRWTPAGSGYEFGFYAVQYHDKAPSAVVYDFAHGNMHYAYAEDIRAYGASVTSSVGDLNWAFEASVRDNAPLTSDPVFLVAPGAECGNSKSNPCYAVGRTAHAQASGIYLLHPTALWEGGVVLAELAWNRRLKVTRDPFAPALGEFGVGGGLSTNTTKDAWALRVLFSPQYFQVLPGLDVSVPIGVGYNFGGRSSSIFNFAGGTSGGGDYSIGLKGEYQNAWTTTLSYNGYYGPEKTFTENVVPGQVAPRHLSFGQSLKDRSYVSFSVQRTF